MICASLVALAACGTPSDDAIDRGVFIDTYVALRVAALETDSQRIATTDRESILADHRVAEGDLDYFAEAHAGDLDFMRDVWHDVELRMDRTASDSR